MDSATCTFTAKIKSERAELLYFTANVIETVDFAHVSIA